MTLRRINDGDDEGAFVRIARGDGEVRIYGGQAAAISATRLMARLWVGSHPGKEMRSAISRRAVRRQGSGVWRAAHRLVGWYHRSVYGPRACYDTWVTSMPRRFVVATRNVEWDSRWSAGLPKTEFSFSHSNSFSNEKFHRYRESMIEVFGGLISPCLLAMDREMVFHMSVLQQSLRHGIAGCGTALK